MFWEKSFEHASSKERAVDLLVEEGLSLNRSLDVVLLPKSSYYYQPKAIDEETMNEIRRLAFRWKRKAIDEFTEG
ncbi:hypothetical protein LEP1GSC202_0401 [Leptospira yanagawae serovar Saopaulo str. Sao Paulo = ATCC 700523]|uniref:Uncharacterized protein n=1 Tax=Leptospira yanagawae serovar Saopaulo str. Sao Paulo = ATCC 700523 TaxID=1249483 RepID=A0A5E8HF12_9LEPT|nr:hypothetical protein [Leptospira yanagawae]EOQ90071.1 hypothetical protein LEP1GSC202_0401 [Leptospira yanagawae serovar Saopaulo str. Sao Paulo = ATCC 700523]